MATADLSIEKPTDGALRQQSSGTKGLSALAEASGDRFSLDVGIGGMHCARCMGLIENALVDEPGVTDARVNFSTERLHLEWQGLRAYGDDLLARITALGYKVRPLGEETGDGASGEATELLKAMAISGFAMGNLMLLSVGLWSMHDGASADATRQLLHWVSALIALPVVIYCGRPFFRSAWGVLRQGHTNMDVPISLALVLASAMSLLETWTGGEHVYFDGAVMLTFFLLIGRYLDARARGRARSSAASLLTHLTGVARVVMPDGQIVDRSVRDLRPGDRLRVAAGERIPADGHVVLGQSDVDTSLMTGETMPAVVRDGDSVFAGTLNMSGSLTVEVAKASDASLLSEIVRLMETAEQSDSEYVRLADRAATLYTPIVHILALGTFLGWWLVMGAAWQPSLLIAISVLIITCPCALGLAVPVVQVLASGHLLQRGILIKSGDALEKLSQVGRIVFDKTGTLTLGAPRLVAGDWDADDLELARRLAAHSRHPLAKALSDGVTQSRPLDLVSEIPGAGLVGTLSGESVKLGSRSFVGLADGVRDSALEVWLKIGDRAPVRFAFEDALRPDAVVTVQALADAGLKTAMLSGDRTEVAQQIGKAVGIQDIHASLKPADKVAALNRYEQSEGPLLMVGDGLNDAPALAAASVSMSPSSAVDISQQAADIVFQGDHLAPVRETWLTALVTVSLVKSNFALAVLYNIVAVPLAVAGQVTPLVAAIAMSSSSLLVVANAFRLRGRVTSLRNRTASEVS